VVSRFLKCSSAVLAVSVGAMSVAHAGCSSGFCSNEEITTLYVSKDVYIRTSGDESQLNCNLLEGQYLTLRRDHEKYDAIYAFLLSAYHQREAVTIRVREGTDGCNIAYVRDDR